MKRMQMLIAMALLLFLAIGAFAKPSTMYQSRSFTRLNDTRVKKGDYLIRFEGQPELTGCFSNKIPDVGPEVCYYYFDVCYEDIFEGNFQYRWIEPMRYPENIPDSVPPDHCVKIGYEYRWGIDPSAYSSDPYVWRLPLDTPRIIRDHWTPGPPEVECPPPEIVIGGSTYDDHGNITIYKGDSTSGETVTITDVHWGCSPTPFALEDLNWNNLANIMQAVPGGEGPIILQDPSDSVFLSLPGVCTLDDAMIIYLEITSPRQYKEFYQVYVVPQSDIPTLTEWGIIIFCVLLFGWMAWVIVRRRKGVNVRI